MTPGESGEGKGGGHFTCQVFCTSGLPLYRRTYREIGQGRIRYTWSYDLLLLHPLCHPLLSTASRHPGKEAVAAFIITVSPAQLVDVAESL